MIEAEHRPGPEEGVGNLGMFPGLWLHRRAGKPGFVELVMPRQEADELLADCEQEFPAFAAAVIALIDTKRSLNLAEVRSSPEVAQGLFNMLLLATALGKKTEKRHLETSVIREAFHCAFQGRFKLVAESSLAL